MATARKKTQTSPKKGAKPAAKAARPKAVSGKSAAARPQPAKAGAKPAAKPTAKPTAKPAIPPPAPGKTPAPSGKDADPKEYPWYFEDRGRRRAVIGGRRFRVQRCGKAH